MRSVAFLAMCLMTCSEAWACDCARSYVSADKAFDLDSIMAETKVIASAKAGKDKNGFSLARITARVVTAIKGVRPGRVITFVANVDTTCDQDAKPGGDYYLFGTLTNGRFSTDGYCSPRPDNPDRYRAIKETRREEFERLEAAVSRDKGSEALDRLGAFLIEKHDWMPALDALEEAQSRDPRGDRTYEIALARAATGDRAKAMTVLRRAGGGDARARILIAGLSATPIPGDPEVDACGAQRASLDMNGRSLSGRNLTRLPLTGLDVKGLDARGADLTYADLRCTKMDAARLDGVDLRQADLRGSDFSNSDLSGADLTGATTDCRTKLPPGLKNDEACSAGVQR